MQPKQQTGCRDNDEGGTVRETFYGESMFFQAFLFRMSSFSRNLIKVNFVSSSRNRCYKEWSRTFMILKKNNKRNDWEGVAVVYGKKICPTADYLPFPILLFGQRSQLKHAVNNNKKQEVPDVIELNKRKNNS